MILITGGAGYIGSHTVINLLNASKKIVVFDNLENGHIETVQSLQKIGEVKFEKSDSVKNIFDVCERVLDKKIPVEVVGRRAGDARALYANANKVKSVLGWEPQRSIEYSIKTAYEWEQSRNLLGVQR